MMPTGDEMRVVVLVEGSEPFATAAAAQASAVADAAAARLGDAVTAVVATAHVVVHEDERGCAVRDSTLCDIIAHPDTTVRDIEDRVFGHAQFECGYKLIETGQFECGYKLIE